jgi:hypothetical protein
MNYLETFQYEAWVIIKLALSSPTNDPMENVLHINGKYLKEHQFHFMLFIISFLNDDVTIKIIKNNLLRLYLMIEDENDEEEFEEEHFCVIKFLIGLMPNTHYNVVTSRNVCKCLFNYHNK